MTAFLASCPKSNASYLAIDAAIDFVRKNGVNVTIPNHLRNAPTFLHKKKEHQKIIIIHMIVWIILLKKIIFQKN